MDSSVGGYHCLYLIIFDLQLPLRVFGAFRYVFLGRSVTCFCGWRSVFLWHFIRCFCGGGGR